jgi:anti-sigma-K factor RskA
MSDKFHVGESAGAYALGALSADEKQQIEVHAAACDKCKKELAEMKGVASLLPLAAPTYEPSSKLKERILASSKNEDNADAVLRRTVFHTASDIPKRDFWHRPAPVWAGVAGWIGMAATCIVAGIVIGVTTEHNRMVAALSHKTSRSLNGVGMAVAPQAAAVYAVRAEDLNQAVNLIGQSQVWDFSVSKSGEPMPYKVIQPLHVDHAMIVAQMPPAKQGMVYQVWLVREGKVHRGGTVMPGQRSQTIIPMRVKTGDVVAFTMEPQGGSEAPTGPFLMRRTL